MHMELSIISPEKTIFKGEVSSVTFPGEAGQFTVLPNHAALISTLKEGNLSYKTSDGDKNIKIDSGFTEIKENKISVCIEKILK